MIGFEKGDLLFDDTVEARANPPFDAHDGTSAELEMVLICS